MDSVFFSSTLLLAIFVGGIILVLMYILKLFNSSNETHGDQEKNEKCAQYSEKKKESVGGKSKKKVPESKWSNKTDKQGFTHPWLIKSLKGHTGEVLGVDFSSNNKYLISCADEDPEDPGGSSTESNTSSVESVKDSSRPPSAEPSPKAKGLSRRQRKNRKKDDILPEAKRKSKKSLTKQSKKPVVSTPLKIWTKLKMNEGQLYAILQNYIIEEDTMYFMGYPVAAVSGYGDVLVYKPGHKRKKGFDVNAAEFVPKSYKNDDYDSGQGSGHSSDSGEANEDTDSQRKPYRFSNAPKLNYRLAHAVQFNSRGQFQFQLPFSTPPGTKVEPTSVNFIETHDGSGLLLLTANYVRGNTIMKHLGTFDQRKHTCIRCNKFFYIRNRKYFSSDVCRYHWGRLYKTYSCIKEYECCHSSEGSLGCTVSRYHVWSGLEEGPNFFSGYVKTKGRKHIPANGSHGVFALDCEMSYTIAGLEVTKVTVVGADGRIVYDSFVKPENEILDYNTRFSGVTSSDLLEAKTLKQVQSDLMGFIYAESILIGHGLENDLRVLKMLHSNVVDTCHSFPHHLGLPYRRSLKQLARYVLKKDIQGAQHSSYEDAVTALELILTLVRRNHCILS